MIGEVSPNEARAGLEGRLLIPDAGNRASAAPMTQHRRPQANRKQNFPR